MPTPSPDQTRRALALIGSAAEADARKLVAVTNTIDELLTAVPDVIAYYADGTAALAADHYDDLRDAARASGKFVSKPVVNLSEEKIRRATLWASEPLIVANLDDMPDATLAADRLAGVVQKQATQPFRDTILTNQRNDPAAVGWRRHTSASGCRFCRMLAGRGEVYREATARFAAHAHCSCSASPVFYGDDGPDADAMQHVASQRRRTPAQKQELRDHLDTLPDVAAQPLDAIEEVRPYAVMDSRLDSTLRLDDWRTSDDPMTRATAVWQHEYDSNQAIRAAEANLRAGRSAMEGVDVPNVKPLRHVMDPDTAELVEVLTPDDMTNEIERAARVLRSRLDEATPDAPTLYRGMTVGDDFTLTPGQSLDLDVTSFSDLVTEARLYTESDYYKLYRTGTRGVIVEVEPGAAGVSLNGTATGRMGGSHEWVYQGRLTIKSVEEREGLLYAIATVG